MSNVPLNNGRRRFLTATTAVVGGVELRCRRSIYKVLNPSEKAKAAGAPVDVDISSRKAKHEG